MVNESVLAPSTQADLRGSGDLNVSALKGEQFELSLAGSGDVRLENAELGKLSARLAGSGDIWLAVASMLQSIGISIAAWPAAR